MINAIIIVSMIILFIAVSIIARRIVDKMVIRHAVEDLKNRRK